MIFQGELGKLEIEIISRIYPDIIDPENEDSKWLYVDVIVNIPSFTAKLFNTHIQIDELQILYNQLECIVKSPDQSSMVDFWTMENNLKLVGKSTSTGMIKFNIIVEENFNKLMFFLLVDIPSIERFSDELFVELQKYNNRPVA